MQVAELERLKARIETAKADKAKAEGAIERILDTWKTEHNISTLEEAEALLDTMDKALVRDDERLTSLLADIGKASE